MDKFEQKETEAFEIINNHINKITRDCLTRWITFQCYKLDNNNEKIKCIDEALFFYDECSKSKVAFRQLLKNIDSVKQFSEQKKISNFN